MKKRVCVGGLQCPRFKSNPCCYDCDIYDKCDFEDKCEITPEECDNDAFIAQERLNKKGASI